MSNPLALAKRMRSPFDLTAIDPLRTLQRSAESFFDDPRLVQWAGRYATYSGSSPYAAPATLACIPHIEARFGCWYPVGGLDALRTALERVARDAGVEIRTGTDITRIVAEPGSPDGPVSGVELPDGSIEPAEIVVANTDAEHLYADLLPDAAALKRVRRAQRSTSGFVMCVGARGLSAGLHHHNVWFSPSYRAEYDHLDAGRLADDPTIYACVSSVTDASQAPDGCENWFLLVNTPPDVEVDADAYGALVLDRLADRGVDLRPRAEFVHTMTPADIARRYRSPGGAIYGTSSNGKRAAFVRPANRGARPWPVPRRRFESPGRRPAPGDHQRQDRHRDDHRGPRMKRGPGCSGRFRRGADRSSGRRDLEDREGRHRRASGPTDPHPGPVGQRRRAGA